MGDVGRNYGRYLVSACLAGLQCRYNGKDKTNQFVQQLVREGKAVPVCPEQASGLSTPRHPAEIVNGSGADVLIGAARVVDVQGKDVTDFFVRGAFQVLKLAKMIGCKRVILKERSPSCGVRRIADGSFRGVTREGQGVTAALLSKEGIEVVSEDDC